MTQGTLKIHSENILPIIKKWMYSDRDIFLRELVSNACDAIQKLKILRDRGQCDIADEEFRIDVRIDTEAKTLTIADTGIGMSAEEVEKYIAQIAFSGAEDFLEKYQSEQSGDQMIGHFGLGFYSSYMVADVVDIQTLSYQPEAKPAFWSCDGSPQYTLEEGARSERGTEIILHIGDEHEDFLEANRVREILERYCSFLPYPIYFNESRINPKEPLWIKAPSECSEQDYLEFYRHLFPMQEDPLFWIHLNVDYPFHLQGILYFPRGKRQWDPQAHGMSLYCNRVFVSDQVKEVIPEYLLGLHGVIDSPDIPLNVSRSSLAMDRTVRQLGSHISKKVADRLQSQYKDEQDKFMTSWADLELIIKVGAMQDDKFYERIKSLLLWKNDKGDYTTVEDYLERAKEKAPDKVYYAAQNGESEFLRLYQERGLEVLLQDSYIDTVMVGFLEGKLSGVSFQRIDGAVDDALLDKERESSILDEQGKTEAGRLADLVRRKLGREDVEVEAKSLASNSLPAFVMMDEQTRRMRDFMLSQNPQMDRQAMGAFEKRTFVLNTNHPLVQSLESLEKKDASLAESLVQHLYDLSLLSQQEMGPSDLQGFLKRCTEVMEHLATKVTEDKTE